MAYVPGFYRFHKKNALDSPVTPNTGLAGGFLGGLLAREGLGAYNDYQRQKENRQRHQNNLALGALLGATTEVERETTSEQLKTARQAESRARRTLWRLKNDPEGLFLESLPLEQRLQIIKNGGLGHQTLEGGARVMLNTKGDILGSLDPFLYKAWKLEQEVKSNYAVRENKGYIEKLQDQLNNFPQAWSDMVDGVNQGNIGHMDYMLSYAEVGLRTLGMGLDVAKTALNPLAGIVLPNLRNISGTAKWINQNALYANEYNPNPMIGGANGIVSMIGGAADMLGNPFYTAAGAMNMGKRLFMGSTYSGLYQGAGNMLTGGRNLIQSALQGRQYEIGQLAHGAGKYGTEIGLTALPVLGSFKFLNRFGAGRGMVSSSAQAAASSGNPWYRSIDRLTAPFRRGNVDVLAGRLAQGNGVRAPVRVFTNAESSFATRTGMVHLRKGATKLELMEEFVHLRQYKNIHGATRNLRSLENVERQLRPLYRGHPDLLRRTAMEVHAKSLLLRNGKQLGLGRLDRWLLQRQINRIHRFGGIHGGY